MRVRGQHFIAEGTKLVKPLNFFNPLSCIINVIV